MIEVRTNNKPLYLYKLDWYIHVVYKPVKCESDIQHDRSQNQQQTIIPL